MKALPRDDLVRKARNDGVGKLPERVHSELVHTFLEQSYPYEVMFSKRPPRTWADMSDLRKGRLIEPMITRIQQKYALYSQRQGLPRLPDDLYRAPEGE